MATPELSPAEWQAVAIALQDAALGRRVDTGSPGLLTRLYRWATGDAPANGLADPRLEAIRSFVDRARRYHKIDARLVERGLTKIITGTSWTLDLEEGLLKIIDGVREGKVDVAAFAARVATSDFLPGSQAIITCLPGTLIFSSSRAGLLYYARSIMPTVCWNRRDSFSRMRMPVTTDRCRQVRRS